MHEKLDLENYAAAVAGALPGGVLLTTKADGRVNCMTIGWGAVGIDWGVPVFTAYVRTHRFSAAQLEKNPEFTVNVPSAATDKKILGYCGTHSGRDTDKVADLGLTLVEPEVVSVPGIAELPLTLECRVVYRQLQELERLPRQLQSRWYPQDVPSTSTGSNKDAHIAFYGEVVAAYRVV